MTTLLEMPEIRELFSPVSVADYQKLGEFNERGRQTELIRGIIIEKMSKSPAHQYFADKVREILAAQITPEFIARPDPPMTTSDSEPEPDVLVVRGPLERYRHAHPRTGELAVEVAVSSLALDRAKAELYAEAGVKEYWIVCPEEKRVEVYRQPGAKGYGECSEVAAPAVLECAALPGVSVDLAALFA